MFMRAYTQEHGTPPTLRELCKEMGWASTNAAQDTLNALIRKGWCKRGAAHGRSRAYIAIDPVTEMEAATRHEVKVRAYCLAGYKAAMHLAPDTSLMPIDQHRFDTWWRDHRTALLAPYTEGTHT
jgi:SOS-response transcriptional repressor LexA